MSRGLLAALVLVVAAVSGGLGFLASRHAADTGPAAPATPASLVGQPLPDFAFIDLAGQPLTRADFADGPLVLNLWATWCTPCLEEMPLLSELTESLAPRGLKVLGIALDEPGKVASYLAELPVQYPIAITETLAGLRFARALGNGRGLLPYTVFVDRTGTITRVKVGQLDARQATEYVGEIL